MLFIDIKNGSFDVIFYTCFYIDFYVFIVNFCIYDDLFNYLA